MPIQGEKNAPSLSPATKSLQVSRSRVTHHCTTAWPSTAHNDVVYSSLSGWMAGPNLLSICWQPPIPRPRQGSGILLSSSSCLPPHADLLTWLQCAPSKQAQPSRPLTRGLGVTHTVVRRCTVSGNGLESRVSEAQHPPRSCRLLTMPSLPGCPLPTRGRKWSRPRCRGNAQLGKGSGQKQTGNLAQKCPM